MRKSVLICDDAGLARTTLKNILEDAGYEIVGEASNGVQAVEKYKELHPEMVFMDIVMPEMDGIDAVTKIMEYDSDAFIIMCSSLAQQKKVLSAVKAGAKDFIVKPITSQRVLETIAKNDVE